MEEQAIPLPPADIIALLAKDNPQAFNRLVRSSMRLRNIGYERALSDVCSSPVTLREIIELSSFIDDMSKFKQLDIVPKLYSDINYQLNSNQIQLIYLFNSISDGINIKSILISRTNWLVNSGRLIKIADSSVYIPINLFVLEDDIGGPWKYCKNLSVPWYYVIMRKRLSCMRMNPKFALNVTIEYLQRVCRRCIKELLNWHIRQKN